MMLAAMLCLSVLGQGIERLAYSDALAARAPGVAQALQASGLRQIGGDFELVEAGLAFAVFAFLPLCKNIFLALLAFLAWITLLVCASFTIRGYQLCGSCGSQP